MGNLVITEETQGSAVAVSAKIQYESTQNKKVIAINARNERHELSSNRNGLNYIHNPDFQINQRIAAALTSFTGTTTGRTITIDRWGHTTGNATTPQFQHVDTASAPEAGLDSRFYGLYKQITNAAKICLSQVIEGREMMRLRNKKVRIQVKLRKSVGADKTICLGLLQLTSAGSIDIIPATFISAFNGVGVDPTFGTNLALIAPDSDKLDNVAVSGNKLTCGITSAWQRFSGVFTIPSNCKNLVLVIFSNDTLVANDDLLISEVEMHEGQEINEWQARDFPVELLMCQRFFCKTFTYNTVPAQNAGFTGSIRAPITNAGAVGTSWNGASWRFPVVLRVIPTVTFFNPAAANAFVHNVTLGTNATATAGISTGDACIHIDCTGLAAWVVGNSGALQATANAEL